MSHGASLAALADPTRRAIMERLREKPSSVGELAEDLPVSRPAVSQHLRVLTHARLVRARQVGTRRIYAIELRGLRDLRSYLDRFWDEVVNAYAAAAAELGRQSSDRS